ncbi:MAG: bacterial Ig-like domain-containing protein [Clostridia bacterium]|nr:bacterial Ig-like domain-containing protein [Clostridia bacterium]
MKKISKVISIFMAAVLALSVFAVSASALPTELTAGNTKETATKIPSFGTEYVSTLSKAGETDWFKFTTLSEDAYYTIALENYDISEYSNYDTSCLNLYVYDIYNKQVVHIHSTSATNVKLERNTTYYIKVAMGSSKQDSTGNYEVLITYKLDPASNIKDEATTINVNNTYKYSLDGTGDVDWFKFTAPVDGTYKVSLENYNISEYSNYDTSCLNLYVYDIYNKQLARTWKTSNTNVTLEKNVTYYIKVAMGSSKQDSTGNYGFSVNCDSAPTPTVKSLSKITIDSMPNKTSYTVGESFDKTGLVVKAHYSDGTVANVSSYSVSGFSSATAGTKAITVSYTENGTTKTASFNITVTKADEPSTPDTPDTPDEPGSSSTIDIAAILVAIWQFFVGIFNFILGLFA